MTRLGDLERWHDWFDAELERSGDWERACEAADLPETMWREFNRSGALIPRINRQLLRIPPDEMTA